MSEQDALPDPGPLARTLRRLWRWTGVLFATAVLLAATAVGLFRLLVPMAPQYLAEVEARVGTALGVEASVSGLDLRWHLAGPALHLEGVSLAARDDGRRLLAAGEVDVGFQLWTLLRDREVVPAWVRVNGLELDLGWSEEQGLLVAGGPPPTPATSGGAAAPLSDIEVELRSVDLRWHGARELQLRGLTVELEQSDGGIELLVEVPLEGRRSELLIEFSGGAGPDPLRELRVVARRVDLTTFTGIWPELQLDIAGGELELDLSAQLDARWQPVGVQASLVLDAPALTYRAGEERLASFAYQRVAGGFSLRRSEQGLQLVTEDLTFSTARRSSEPMDLSLDLVEDPIRDRRRLALRADVLPLAELAPLAQLLPLAQAAWVAAAAPAGDLLEVEFDASLDEEGLGEPQLRAGFSELSWDRHEGIPGMRGLDGDLVLSAGGGLVTLRSQAVVVDTGELFRDELIADSVEADISILRDEEGVTLRADEVRVLNRDALAVGRASVVYSDAEVGPVLDLYFDVSDAELSSKSTYLPVGIMPGAVVEWLDEAVVSGHVPRGEFELRGPARGFPYRDGSGVFRVRFDLEDLRLDYAEGWPAAEAVAAEVVFEGPGLTIATRAGGWPGLQLDDTLAVIPDLQAGELVITGRLAPDLTDLVRFVSSSPLAERLGAYLDAAEGRGPTQLAIRLDLPLTDLDSHQVDGSLTLVDAEIDIADGAILLREVQGLLNIQEDALSGAGMSARLWGQPLGLELRPDPDTGDTRLLARGVTPVSALPRALRESGRVDRLSGSIPWRLDATFPSVPEPDAAPSQLVVRSDLTGLAIDLPEPFAKPAELARDTVLTVSFPADGRMETRLVQPQQLGAVARWREEDGWALDRAHLRLGGGLPAMPVDHGLWISGRAPQVDADAWYALVADQPQDGPQLRGLSLVLAELTILGQRYDDTRLSLDPADDGWLLHLDGAEARGSVRLPGGSQEAGVVVASFDRLVLRSSEGEEGAEPDPVDPRELPALQLTVQDFELDAARYGSVSLVATPIPAGLDVSELRAEAPSYRLTGSGGWIVDGDQQHSQLRFELNSTDVGATLQRLGYGSGISGRSGNLSADLSWPGSPFGPIVDQLSGQARLDMRNGILYEVEPGAGRLFGLLSVAALPRRLRLDFSDLFGSGLGYDRISADYRLEDGDAYTENLVLLGPAVDVGMSGRIGLAAQDYDQQVLISVKVGASLPVAGALVGGAGVGAALLVIYQLFKDRLEEATQLVYRVTGSWDEPQVERDTTRNGRAPAQGTGG